MTTKDKKKIDEYWTEPTEKVIKLMAFLLY